MAAADGKDAQVFLRSQQATVTEGVFYAYINNINDDNTARYTLIFSSREVADQWWRAVSTSTISILQNNIQRISPQFYTHDPKQMSVYNFFRNDTIAALAAPFKGKLFMALENDRDGRGITIIPTIPLVDHISGNWFTIRSRANRNHYWFFDESVGPGYIVISNTKRTSFKVSAPDLPNGMVIIGTDDVVLFTRTRGYITPGANISSIGVATLTINSETTKGEAFRFQFEDLKNGKFTSNAEHVLGSAIIYALDGDMGTGQWELSL